MSYKVVLRSLLVIQETFKPTLCQTLLWTLRAQQVLDRQSLQGSPFQDEARQAAVRVGLG